MRFPRKWRVLIWVLAALALISAIAIILWSSQRFRLPWRDSFASNDIGGWQAFGGAWTLYQGGIRNNSDERGAKFLTGSTAWSNYAVDADIMLLGDDGDAGIIVRSSNEEEGVDSYSGYYVGLRDSNNSITIGRADHGWIEFQTVSPRQPLQPSRWYHLHVVAVGCDIVAVTSGSASGDHTWVAMHEPSCSRTGRIGLRSYSSGGVWKNIRVVKAGQADLQPLLAHAPPGPPIGTLQTEAGFNSLLTNQLGIPPRFAQALRSAATTSLVSIGDLPMLSPVHSTTVTIRGSITLTSPRVYVQDATGGATVEFTHPSLFKLGDEVQVTGKVEPSRFSAVLRDATGRVLWQRSPAPPISISATEAATGHYDARFIETEAEVDALRPRSQRGTVLMLHSGHQRFLAIIDPRFESPITQHIAPHSIVRVRGICVVDPDFTGNAAPFAILLRSSSDIRLLAGPPWWSLRNLVFAAITLLILAILGLFIYSRADRWRTQAVLNERLHMAREIHDTLAQGYAAIALQLESTLDRDNRTQAPEGIVLALQMAERSRSEAHFSIASLRALHFDTPFPTLVRDLLRNQITTGIMLNVRSHGSERRLSAEIESNLLRIVQECVANAVRHANASIIEVEIDYSPERVSVLILDNGHGFDLKLVPGIQEGHYGITGMRERSGRIGAAFHIGSGPFGTRASVHVPLTHSPSIAGEYLVSLFRWTLYRFSTFSDLLTHYSEHLGAKKHSRFDLG